MSGAAANSSARRRRAKPMEQSKPNDFDRKFLQDEDTPIIPSLTIKESLFFLNKKIDLVIQDMNMKLNNNLNKDTSAVDCSINLIAEKLDDTTIAIQIKQNMLEQKTHELENIIKTLSNDLEGLSNTIIRQKSFFEKAESLVIYQNDSDGEDEDSSNDLIEQVEV